MAQTTQSAVVNIAASQTDTQIVAADTYGIRQIKVVSVAMVVGSSATNVTFNSKGSGAGTAISCLFANGANGGAILNRNEDGWFWTKAGQALTATTGSGATTGIIVNWVYV